MAHDVDGKNKSKKDVDIFRETNIRFLGYANEVGESFRAFIPRWLVNSSYVVASFYCLADASHKGHDALKKKDVIQELRAKRSIGVFIEAVLWQAFASVIIPGFTINRICRVSNISLSKVASSSLSLRARNGITSAIGLTCIPVIIKPIDWLVDTAMEHTVTAAKQIFLQESDIEDSIQSAVEGRTDIFGDSWR